MKVEERKELNDLKEKQKKQDDNIRKIELQVEKDLGEVKAIQRDLDQL